jgi:NitT/TauT family transport system permease protein
LALVAGLSLGILMNMSRALENALWPWLIALQVTPIIVLTPIIVRVAGPTFGARVFVTVLIAFFPIASTTLFG